MDLRSALGRFLTTDADDAGCAETFRVMDVYAELTLADKDAAKKFPGVAAHLRSCDPCAQDLAGLLAAL